jgi:hypothetical protein
MAAALRDVYRMLEIKGPGRATSSRGTEYRIEARNGSIVAFPRIVHKSAAVSEVIAQLAIEGDDDPE